MERLPCFRCVASLCWQGHPRQAAAAVGLGAAEQPMRSESEKSLPNVATAQH